MNLLVISDTHGNLKGMRKALERLVAGRPVDLAIHLGDNYEDAEVFDEYGLAYVRVPGVFSDVYRDRSVPNRLVKEFEGWRCLLSHTQTSHANDLPGDPRPEALTAAGQVHVVLYGHSHIPRLEEQDAILFVNPGHLKDEDKKGYTPSYALLDVMEDAIKARLVEAETGNVIKELVYRRVDHLE